MLTVLDSCMFRQKRSVFLPKLESPKNTSFTFEKARLGRAAKINYQHLWLQAGLSHSLSLSLSHSPTLSLGLVCQPALLVPFIVILSCWCWCVGCVGGGTVTSLASVQIQTLLSVVAVVVVVVVDVVDLQQRQQQQQDSSRSDQVRHGGLKERESAGLSKRERERVRESFSVSRGSLFLDNSRKLIHMLALNQTLLPTPLAPNKLAVPQQRVPDSAQSIVKKVSTVIRSYNEEDNQAEQRRHKNDQTRQPQLGQPLKTSTVSPTRLDFTFPTSVREEIFDLTVGQRRLKPLECQSCKKIRRQVQV